MHPRADVQVMNLYATGNIQSGTMMPVVGAAPLWDAGSSSPSAAVSSRLIFRAKTGLTGNGEVVGCGDTGLDVDSCFFWDSQQPIPFDGTR